MGRICFILVAGLDQSMLRRAKDAGVSLPTLAAFSHAMALEPVWPAVTCPMQATLTTGAGPAKHGIIANGLYTYNQPALHAKLDMTNMAEVRREVSFWEQSNELLDAPRFWQGSGKKVAMLFWQNSMKGAADIVVTPKPEHSADGKTLTACWSSPPELYGEQAAKFGPFPLHHYWSPMAGLPSTTWIVNSAIDVWQRHSPDLELVYIPHLDFNLQRLGPNHTTMMKDLVAVDAELKRLVDTVRETGATPIVAGDYAMTEVNTGILPNVTLRQAGLLTTRQDASAKVLIDYGRSAAFAMCDHQIAHVYAHKSQFEETVAALYNLPCVERIITKREDLAALGLDHPRSGNIVLIAQSEGWFGHDWWYTESEKPMWQFSVDIHRKPGFDPRELFMDMPKKIIAQSIGVVKGSHGRVAASATEWPVLLCDAPLAPVGQAIKAPAVAGWLRGLLG